MIIKSTSYDEEEILRNIITLHCEGRRIDLDPTYSTGRIYRGGGIQQPRLKSDIEPQSADVVKADVRKLPLAAHSVDIVLIDPPFTMNGESRKQKHQKTGLIGKRFASFKDWRELSSMYRDALVELFRVISPGGVLIFKCQDSVVSGKNYFTHVWIMNEAERIGFVAKDLFVLLSTTRMIFQRKQQHARKYHSYYWVFKK